jgi:hypothetical protein
MPRHEGSQTSLRFDVPKHGTFKRSLSLLVEGEAPRQGMMIVGS